MVQSWADDWEWNQMWRLVGKDDKIPTKEDTSVTDSDKTVLPYLGDFASVYGTSVHYADNHLFVELGSRFVDGAAVSVLDLQGRVVLRKQAVRTATFDVQALVPGIYHVVVRDGNRADIARFKK